jgi:hypothetical protein
MIETFHDRDKVLTKYLLDELGDAERSGLEEAMLLDEELFERAQVVEMNLIDGYVRGEMSAEESLRFEEGFMALPDNADKVNRARMFHNSLRRLREKESAASSEAAAAKKQGWLRRLGELFRTPFPALALAASVLLLIFAAFYAPYFNPRPTAGTNEMAANLTPPVPRQSPAASPPNNSPPANVAPPQQTSSPAASPTKEPPVRVPPSAGAEVARNEPEKYTKEVCLFCEGQAGVERGGADPMHITLGEGIRYLKLKYELLGDIRERDTYFVTIKNRYNDAIKLKDGEKRQEVRQVKRKEKGREKRFIIITLPVGVFEDDGSYKFEIDEPNFSPSTFTINR